MLNSPFYISIVKNGLSEVLHLPRHAQNTGKQENKNKTVLPNIPKITKPKHYRWYDHSSFTHRVPENLEKEAIFAEVKEIQKTVKKFLKTYPPEKNRYVALGRSPLFFLETVKATKGGRGFTQVSSTGGRSLARLLTKNQLRSNMAMLLTPDDAQFENWSKQLTPIAVNLPQIRKRLQQYQTYLEAKGLSPEAIARRGKNGKKTVLVDGVGTGESIKIFTDILITWAINQGLEKELKDSLNLVLFPSSPHYTFHSLQTYFKENELKYEILSHNATLSSLMDNDSHELGNELNINGLRFNNPSFWPASLQDIFHQEDKQASSPWVSQIRFLIMKALDQKGQLR